MQNGMYLAYNSKKLTAAQHNHTKAEKELFAIIVMMLTNSKKVIMGSKIIVHSEAFWSIIDCGGDFLLRS